MARYVVVADGNAKRVVVDTSTSPAHPVCDVWMPAFGDKEYVAAHIAKLLNENPIEE